MPRFIGSKFGDFVGVNTVNGFCDSGVYNYNDQAFLNEAGAWQGFSASGGLESTPGNGYKYHTFLSSGSFVVEGSVHPVGMEVLVIGGGGGGGEGTVGQGGGGAGGFRVQGGPGVVGPTGSHGPATPLTIPVGSTTITVGEGGGAGQNGENSSIGSLLVATGGGSGGRTENTPTYSGSSGGSSGGASNTESSAPTNGNAGGFSPFPEGNNGGGSAGGVASEGGGGGGGAGANGQPSPGNATAGVGGAGLQMPLYAIPLLHPDASPLSPYNNYYAGGGGGGTIRNPTGGANGGQGGGGGGGSCNPAVSGVTETATAGISGLGGGGGGGSIEPLGPTALSAPGGDGIVIIRYTV